MRIELGATVRTLDGKMAGKVSQLDVDPSKRTLDSFIVHTGLLGEDLIVPVDDIARVDPDDTIHLKITTTQLRALPQLFVAPFVRDESWRPEGEIPLYQMTLQGVSPITAGGLSAPTTSLGQQLDPVNPATGAFIGITDTSLDVATITSSLPDNEFGITHGTRVVTADGHHVGKVHELRVTDEGALDGLVIATGLFHTHRYYIAFTEVRDAGSDEVRLRMTAAQLEEFERASRSAAGDTTGDTTKEPG